MAKGFVLIIQDVRRRNGNTHRDRPNRISVLHRLRRYFSHHSALRLPLLPGDQEQITGRSRSDLPRIGIYQGCCEGVEEIADSE